MDDEGGGGEGLKSQGYKKKHLNKDFFSILQHSLTSETKSVFTAHTVIIKGEMCLMTNFKQDHYQVNVAG